VAEPCVPPAAAQIAVSDPARPASSFDALDDALCAPETAGVFAVEVTLMSELRAVAAHIERRMIATGRRVVRAPVAEVDGAFHGVARQLRIDPVPHDPLEAARAIAGAAGSATVVVPLVEDNGWDAQVAAALAGFGAPTLVVVICTRVVSELRAGASFQLGSRLNDAELARWWAAVAAQQAGERSPLLSDLDALASAALAAEPASSGAELPPLAVRLLARLRLARRAWPLANMVALGDDIGVAILRAAGLVEIRDGLVSACAPAEHAPAAPDDEDRLAVARALARSFPGDAWAHARAGELAAELGDLAAAEASFCRSLELAEDGASRAFIWRRFDELIDRCALKERASARLRGAELALGMGDVDVARQWAEQASRAAAEPRAALVLGRAALARGDLVSADAALSRARDRAADGAARCEALVELGEVSYARGDLGAAERFVRDALELAEAPRLRLGARNLAGKLLLSRAEWNAADAHFAADACDAAAFGDRVGELRARVNRAIALMSRGSPDEARPMLLEVLRDAESHGERRAMGFALSNLAVLAIERHDYAEALELSERAIVVRRRLGDRLGFARDVTNLVELRLRLGLFEQAEQALRFGRQALGPGAPASRLTELGLAAARVHLQRGRTLEAEREARAALRTAAHASDGDKLAECHRLAARIALEDGLVARARAEVERAAELAQSPFSRAEALLLRAMVARAAGEPSDALAADAVLASREAGDEELARDAHVLAAEVALAAGDDASALEHVRAAAALRDEVTRGLGRGYEEAYLARRDLLRLARIERLAGGRRTASDEERIALSPVRPRAPDFALRYVGRHPGVRALLDSLKRVGRTDATVLIRGESGTGKELIAEGIHAASERADGPLIKVNCAALVESLLLSELFGHEKGAFTGAGARRRGRFERAHGGTLFLDEIGDISPRTQVALLRALEERSIERVGGTSPIPVDVRIVCATNRDLSGMLERGEFREDLYYRLSGIVLEVPPLRERASDLPQLCDALLDRIARERGLPKKYLAVDALELLSRHRWPGNVRELENALRAASLLSDGDVIELKDLVEHVEVLRKLSAEPPAAPHARLDVTRSTTPPPRSVASSCQPLESAAGCEALTGVAYDEIRSSGVSLSELKKNIERDCILRALSETNGNITRAAALLGMKRPRLSQLVKHYGLLDVGEDA
jgi:transcriptional regulator with GAF, ATPase, and Fis domain